jgi:plastocyanin
MTKHTVVTGLVVIGIAGTVAGCGGSSGSSSTGGGSASASSAGAGSTTGTTESTGEDTSEAPGENTTENSSSSPTAGTLAVQETEYRISPANPTIAKRGTVRITIKNAGALSHALEVEGPSGETKSDTVEPGESEAFTVDFAKAGTYTWFCPIPGHRQKGMQGQVTVR